MNDQNLLIQYSISDSKFFSLLFLIAFVSYIYDFETNVCFVKTKQMGLHLFLYFHHVVALFLYFGWLSSSKTILILYAFTIFIIILHWFTNDQKCIITQIVNYYCGLPDAEGFHDIFYFLGMKQQDWFNSFIYSYLGFVFIITLYKIYLLS
jgi:hypothetical protein